LKVIFMGMTQKDSSHHRGAASLTATFASKGVRGVGPARPGSCEPRPPSKNKKKTNNFFFFLSRIRETKKRVGLTKLILIHSLRKNVPEMTTCSIRERYATELLPQSSNIVPALLADWNILAQAATVTKEKVLLEVEQKLKMSEDKRPYLFCMSRIMSIGASMDMDIPDHIIKMKPTPIVKQLHKVRQACVGIRENYDSIEFFDYINDVKSDGEVCKKLDEEECKKNETALCKYFVDGEHRVCSASPTAYCIASGKKQNQDKVYFTGAPPSTLPAGCYTINTACNKTGIIDKGGNCSKTVAKQGVSTQPMETLSVRLASFLGINTVAPSVAPLTEEYAKAVESILKFLKSEKFLLGCKMPDSASVVNAVLSFFAKGSFFDLIQLKNAAEVYLFYTVYFNTIISRINKCHNKDFCQQMSAIDRVIVHNCYKAYNLAVKKLASPPVTYPASLTKYPKSLSDLFESVIIKKTPPL